MEREDKIGHLVLQKNCSFLSSVIDARKILSGALRRDLIGSGERAKIEEAASREGPIAGMERMMQFLLQRRKKGTFKIFLEVLESGSEDVKSWAEYLRDVYEIERNIDGIDLADSADEIDSVEKDTTSASRRRKLFGLREWKSYSDSTLAEQDKSVENVTISQQPSPISKRSIPVDCVPLIELTEVIDKKVTPPNSGKMKKHSLPAILQESLEQMLFRRFREAQHITAEDVGQMLKSYVDASEGGDPRLIRDHNNNSMLHVASRAMDFRVVRLLVEGYDFDLNEMDLCGNTALHIAVLAEKIQTVMYIGSKSACDPNVRNRDGSTPLHLAAGVGSVVMLRFLLNIARLDRHLRNREGISAFQMIHSDPGLVSCLKKNTVTGSLIGTQRPVIVIRRPVSHEDSDGGTEEVDQNISNGRLPPHEEDSAAQHHSNGDRHTQSFPDKEEVIIKDEFPNVVIRDKPKTQYFKPYEEERVCGGCYCCSQRRTETLQKKESTFQIYDGIRFCQMCITVSFMLLGIFIILGVIGALVYYLKYHIKDSDEQ